MVNQPLIRAYFRGGSRSGKDQPCSLLMSSDQEQFGKASKLLGLNHNAKTLSTTTRAVLTLEGQKTNGAMV